MPLFNSRVERVKYLIFIHTWRLLSRNSAIFEISRQPLLSPQKWANLLHYYHYCFYYSHACGVEKAFDLSHHGLQCAMWPGIINTVITHIFEWFFYYCYCVLVSSCCPPSPPISLINCRCPPFFNSSALLYIMLGVSWCKSWVAISGE